MSTANAAWGGRKGRTMKEVPARSAAARMVTKHPAYASSHLLGELNSIVILFTEEQRKLAESAGFRAFAKPVHEIEFDRQFIVWLLPKVDTISRAISQAPGKKLSIFHEDVAKVFGIPCCGKEVWDASLDKSAAMRRKIEGIIGMDEESNSPSAAAAKTLRDLAGRELSAEEGIVFKVSFVVFVVCMLCDSNNPGEQESVNFWPALNETDSIHTFNWASYVLDAAFSSCAAAKMATRRNIAYMPAAGAALFLQIFYLDNMDYGQNSLPKGDRPRMELYDARTLSKQILAETIGLRGQTPCRMFGAGKARSDADVVYRRGLLRPGKEAHAPSTNMQGSNPPQQKRSRPDASVAARQTEKPPTKSIDQNMILLLALKAHKARCLKILTMARKSIEEESEKLLETFNHINLEQNQAACGKLPQEEQLTPSPTLTGPRELQRSQACDAPSFSLGPEFEEIVVSGPAISPQTPVSPIGPSPPRKTMRKHGPASPVSATKKKSGEFLFNKRSSDKINLNEEVAELEFTQSPITRKTVREGRIICPPRDTASKSCHRRKEAANSFYNWAMESVCDRNRFWVRHGTPKFIEISSADLVSQFEKNGRLEPDTCDALLRQFQQSCVMDWRHFLETDFPMRIVAGEDYISSRSIQQQWVGKHIKKDISKCMLFMTMVRVVDTWAAIAWDMKRRQITIHAAGNKNGEWEAYDTIVDMLKPAFRRCTEVFFEGWTVDWENWATVYTTSSSLTDPKPSGYDYGPETLQFCRTFDGVKQGGRLTAAKPEYASPAELLFDLLHLKNNTGSLPTQFVQHIDD